MKCLSLAKLVVIIPVTLALSCLVLACGIKPTMQRSELAEKPLTIIDTPVHFNESVVIDNEVVIMPGAYITTGAEAKVSFDGRIQVVGKSHVFDQRANIYFAPGTIAELNVAWFGARGYDNEDDTQAFKAVLQKGYEYFNSVTIDIPIGRYFISETLLIQSNPTQKKSINLRGGGMSNSGVQGANMSWRGAPGSTMIEISHNNQFFIEYLDFTSEPGSRLQHTITLRPFIHQVFIRHCLFTGVEGPLAANINLNQGNGDQVSEIHFDNCTFNGLDFGAGSTTPFAISGGLANTKNIYIAHCAFSSYANAAIGIDISDVLRVEGCTFANNEVDIYCGLGGTYAISNYSEASNCFFEGGASSNIAVTTLMNNVFAGNPRDGYVIRDGSGRLCIINNVFGGSGTGTDVNRVRWESGEFNSVYSQGNFFKNADNSSYPFHNRSNRIHRENVISTNDMGGQNSLLRKSLD